MQRATFRCCSAAASLKWLIPAWILVKPSAPIWNSHYVLFVQCSLEIFFFFSAIFIFLHHTVFAFWLAVERCQSFSSMLCLVHRMCSARQIYTSHHSKKLDFFLQLWKYLNLRENVKMLLLVREKSIKWVVRGFITLKPLQFIILYRLHLLGVIFRR